MCVLGAESMQRKLFRPDFQVKAERREHAHVSKGASVSSTVTSGQRSHMKKRPELPAGVMLFMFAALLGMNLVTPQVICFYGDVGQKKPTVVTPNANTQHAKRVILLKRSRIRTHFTFCYRLILEPQLRLR